MALVAFSIFRLSPSLPKKFDGHMDRRRNSYRHLKRPKPKANFEFCRYSRHYVTVTREIRTCYVRACTSDKSFQVIVVKYTRLLSKLMMTMTFEPIRYRDDFDAKPARAFCLVNDFFTSVRLETRDC